MSWLLVISLPGSSVWVSSRWGGTCHRAHWPVTRSSIPETSRHHPLRHVRRDHRRCVSLERIRTSLRHDCHSSSTVPPRESCGHSLNRTSSRPWKSFEGRQRNPSGREPRTTEVHDQNYCIMPSGHRSHMSCAELWRFRVLKSRLQPHAADMINHAY